MTITVLGSGTSQGVPVIGCDCDACTSSDPVDKRLRSALLISDDDTQIVIDVGPDFRQQMLNNAVNHLDAVLLTHEHNDHVIGLDDLRPFIFKLRAEMPIYAQSRVNHELRNRFSYAFSDQPYPGAPRFALHDIDVSQKIKIGSMELEPLAVKHGRLDILGYKVGRFAYITDASALPDDTITALQDVDILIVNALRREPHHSHFTLDQAIALIESLDVQTAYLTHISHALGPYAAWRSDLPEHVHCAYDGLVLNI